MPSPPLHSPRTTPRIGTRGYAHLVEIEASLARVWQALTDPVLMRMWSAEEAQIDARRGGLYRLGEREAHIDIFDANRRLRLIYLKDAGQPPSESAVVGDFLLDVRKEGLATLRLLGSGISEAPEWDKSYMRMRMVWERYLARIKVILETPSVPKQPEPPRDRGLPGLDY